VAVAYSWRAPDGSRTTWAQVLTLINGKIMRMRDYARQARALRSVRNVAEGGSARFVGR
jgi:hypothetical protein